MPRGIDWTAINNAVDGLAEKHALKTGLAISKWNQLQDFFGRVFAEIVSPKNHRLALAIWYSQESDRAQRKMLKAATKSLFGAEAKLHLEIKWLCDRADDLAEGRNNVVHVSYSIAHELTDDSVTLKPRGTGSHWRADTMNDKDVLAELDKIVRDCEILCRYIFLLMPFVVNPAVDAEWPNRPKLPKGLARLGPA